jgi:hypothetical protein
VGDRNPKIDPKPGDVLRKGDIDILVIAVTSTTVYYSKADARDDSFPLLGYQVPIGIWRRKAEDAEVLNG